MQHIEVDVFLTSTTDEPPVETKITGPYSDSTFVVSVRAGDIDLDFFISDADAADLVAAALTEVGQQIRKARLRGHASGVNDSHVDAGLTAPVAAEAV